MITLPQNPLPFLNNGVTQIGFVVKDLDRTVEMYWKVFGIAPWHFYTYGEPMVKVMHYKGKPAQYRMRVALSYFGTTRIELIEMLEGETVYADFHRVHGFGVQHLGLVVDDMQSALDQVKACGIKVLMDGSGFGLDGDGMYAYLDTEELFGTTLELIQRPARRVEPEKIFPPPIE